MPTANLRWDGRWVTVALLLVYHAMLLLAGPPDELPARWRRAGVHALELPFADLQLFPATRATVESGGEVYGANAADPLQRPFNYPRVWLLFMRFPASDHWIRGIGCALALTATSAVLFFWGRLSTAEGVFGGLLLCSPAFQLGVERGNTDLAMLALLVTGILLAESGQRRRLPAAVWWLAATLKLYPVLAFGGWFEGPVRVWLRRVWLPLGLFAVYLAATWRDLAPTLFNTGGGWVQSYGSEALAVTVGQVQAFYGMKLTGGFSLAGVGRVLAAGGVGWILIRGWLKASASPVPAPADSEGERRARLGFRIGTLVYVGTFVAGSSFDYRQSFLLLAVPRLLAGQRRGERQSAVALAALLFSLGTNYLLAGWPRAFLNETAGWALLFVLAAMLAKTWRGVTPAAA